jgi:3-methyladenine DNA glycosylase/8-oxoguanine DNA glycosylase
VREYKLLMRMIQELSTYVVNQFDSFICSSNNNIARIGQMVQNLCTHFSGKKCCREG